MGSAHQPLRPEQRCVLQHGPGSRGEHPKAAWPGRENGQTTPLKARIKLLLGGAGWKGLLQAGKGNVGPERRSLCALAMALLSPPVPDLLGSVPELSESLDTRAVPQHGQRGLRGHQEGLCPALSLAPGEWCQAEPALPRPRRSEGPRSGQDRGSGSPLLSRAVRVSGLQDVC